jgi:hypothetical protein
MEEASKKNGDTQRGDIHLEVYYRKTMEASKLINEESNRLITWSLAIIGGTILIVVSTNYINPTGAVLYAYFLFAIGWIYLGLSILYGEEITRIYIAGAMTNEKNLEEINKIGKEIDKRFGKQIKCFKKGIVIFSIWLVIFLFWYIITKK